MLCPACLRVSVKQMVTKVCTRRPGRTIDDLTADPDFDWVAKWIQVNPLLAQGFNFVMMVTVRAVARQMDSRAETTFIRDIVELCYATYRWLCCDAA